jgi:5-methylthioadenosine/S-adenosylhomocysteine deaminase
MRAVAGRLAYVDGAFEEGRAVLIQGDSIADVVERDRVPDGVSVQDWGNVALTPGTVNAHGHAFQSLLKGLADDRPFDGWRDDVLYPFSERLGADAIYAGALFAFAEALLAGATSTVDFFYLHDSGNDNARAVIRAAQDIGIRLVLARAFYDPDAPTGAPKRYREPAGDAADRTLELAREYEADPAVFVQPAPHSLHAASPETIRVALDVAGELGVPCHLHVAEAKYEREQIAQRFGATPVKLLDREDLLSERLIAIHCVWLDDDEIGLLADSGAAVVHCPAANAFLGDGMAKLPEMLERGVRVGLGPDGGCANNRQSVFDEMRSASLLAKARLCDGGAIDAATAFRLGTAGGAEILGINAGELAPGRLADLIALDLSDLSLHPLGQLERHVVHSMQQTAIAKAMVGGDLVVDNRQLVKIDTAEVQERVARATHGWSRP